MPYSRHVLSGSARLLKAINAIRMGGVEVLPLVEGGKGVAVSSGATCGAWAASGGVGTFSAVNADSYDSDGKPIPQLYHGKTRRDRHEELVRYAIDGAITQAKRAWEMAGGKGRMCTWAYSYGYTNSTALAEYGKRIVEGKAKLGNKKDLFTCYALYTPGAKWNGGNYTDLGTGITKKNMVLVYQDTYIFGRGYMNATSVKVPEKYNKIQFKK